MEDYKSVLRKTTVKKIIHSTTHDELSVPITRFLKSLFAYPESIEQAIEELNSVQSIKFITTILDVIYSTLSENSSLDEEHQTKIIKLLLQCVETHFPATYTKSETSTFIFLFSISKFLCLYPKITIANLPETQTNSNISALILIFISQSSEIDPTLYLPLISNKLTNNLLSYSSYYVLAKFSNITDGPTIRNIISAFKSISDDTLIPYLSCPMIDALIRRLDASNVKELTFLLSYLPKKLRKDPAGTIKLAKLIEQACEFPDTLVIFKPYFEELVYLCLFSIKNGDIKPTEEVKDVMSVIRQDVAEAFMTLVQKFNFNPFESFFASKAVNHPLSVLLMMAYIVKNAPDNFVQENHLDIFTNFVQINKKPDQMSILVHICFYFVIKFQSKKALKSIILALDNESEVASEYLLSKELTFDFIFDDLASNFKPDSSPEIYAKTLTKVLKSHLPESPQLYAAERNDIPESDSNFDLIPRADTAYGSEQEIAPEATPTSTTILFCSVLTALEKNVSLFDMLPLTASAISPSFSQTLVSKFPSPNNTENFSAIINKRRYQLHSLAAYGTALQTLDKTTLNALAQTFLMLRPDESMLYLAITLQMVPKGVADSCLKKTLHFAADYPEMCSKMIALVSYAHPSVAMNFINNMINDSYSKRRFAFFRAAVLDDKMVIVVLKTIGSCSTFIEGLSFSNDFLSFATNFLNKYLSVPQPNQAVNAAALFAIRKLGNRLASFQSENSEHLFAFKDFVVQYVCNYYMEIGDQLLSNNTVNKELEIIISILGALTAMMPIRPVRFDIKHLRAIELTAVLLQVIDVENFCPILKATQTFLCTCVECQPTLSTFTAAIKPLFPALLMHSEWKQIANLLACVCAKWEKVSLAESSETLNNAIASICTLISYALPLVNSDAGKSAADVVCSLISLSSSARNQILSLPKSIRPPVGDISNVDKSELCNTVCGYVSKSFLTDQVFDVINSLIELLGNSKVLQDHHCGLATGVEQLLKLRGREEFRFDKEIVGGLCRSAFQKDDSVIEIIIRILSMLFKSRLVSVLSSFMESSANLSDSFLDLVFKEIAEIENGITKISEEIARVLSTDTSSTDTVSFCNRALTILKKSIETVPDDVFAHLIVSCLKRPKAFQIIAGEDYEEFVHSIPQMHHGSMSIIAADKDIMDAALMLCFAAADDETCQTFLSGALDALSKQDAKVTKIHFSRLETIFKTRTPSSFDGIADKISNFLSSFIVNEFAFDAVTSFIAITNKKDAFWHSLAIKERESIITIMPISVKIFKVTAPNAEAIAPLLARAAVLPQQESTDLIDIAASSLNVKPGKTLFDTAVAVMKCDAMIPFRKEILEGLTRFIRANDHTDEASTAVTLLCQSIDDENAFAIEAVVEKLASALTSDNDAEVNAIIRLLSN